MKKVFFLFFAGLFIANTTNCKAQSAEREDYVCQDGFYFSRDGGAVIPNDTALHRGVLSDGTHFLSYRNEHQDFDHDSVIVQRVVSDAEQTLIIIGDIEYQQAIRRLEEIVQNADSLQKIPLYSEANIYRFGGVMTQYQDRIDLRIPIIPAVHPELRTSSFSNQHFANFCLLSLYIDHKLTKLKSGKGLPESIEDITVYPNLLLDGKDRECLCFHIEAKPGKEELARTEIRRCLELFVHEPCIEVELNMLRENFRRMVRFTYFNSLKNAALDNQAILKRVADAYILGNEYYDFKSEGEHLIAASAACYSEFINAMYEATILHNPNY